MNEPAKQSLRRAIIDALPQDTSFHGQTPPEHAVYVPPSHVKALRLECGLVIGTRGVGKTFWSAALRSKSILNMLGTTAISDLSRVEVSTGFAETPNIEAYPDAETFGSLLNCGYEPYNIWRAVIRRWATSIVAEVIQDKSWKESVTWVVEQPESFARLIERANASLEVRGQSGLIVFDALDRSSSDWQTMDRIVRDLLRVVLWLKRFPRLNGKVFLRDDQYSGRQGQITNFPDASKLLATRVELTWASHDLHGLLWQYLCNGSQELRIVYSQVVGKQPMLLPSGVWSVGDAAKREGDDQKALFSALAGEWMGRDKRRGIPYSWSVGHLADGRGRTSPRSFIAAIRAAAEDSTQRYAEHELALHYESIKRGVQEASQIRVDELTEDYPWVQDFMAPLRGLSVPCQPELVEERWISYLGAAPSKDVFASGSFLPPERYLEGWSGIRQDIEALGLFETMKDKRINMPDLYRVGFGLGRKGGVKPVSKQPAE